MSQATSILEILFCIHISPLSWASFPSPIPLDRYSTPVTHHRTLSWTPHAILQFLINYLFFTIWCIYVNTILSMCPTLSFSHCVDNRCTVQQKLTQHCKESILQFNFFLRNFGFSSLFHFPFSWVLLRLDTDRISKKKDIHELLRKYKMVCDAKRNFSYHTKECRAKYCIFIH